MEHEPQPRPDIEDLRRLVQEDQILNMVREAWVTASDDVRRAYATSILRWAIRQLESNAFRWGDVAFFALMRETEVVELLSDEQRQRLATAATVACLEVLKKPSHQDLKSRLVTDAVERVLREREVERALAVEALQGKEGP
jgi:hypothetical protein